MLNISVLVSGGGSNLQSIIDHIKDGTIQGGRIVQIISSQEEAYALVRARENQIPGKYIGKKNWPDPKERDQALLQALEEAETDLIVLAGYMSILSETIIQKYRGKIINIHPSLIPKFCGKGFYGKKVHAAVLDAGERVSGATVHYVDEGVDTGEIIMQRMVKVERDDTPDTLAERVLKVEHAILPEVIRLLCEKEKK